MLIEGGIVVCTGDKLPEVHLNCEVFAIFDCQSLKIMIMIILLSRVAAALVCNVSVSVLALNHLSIQNITLTFSIFISFCQICGNHVSTAQMTKINPVMDLVKEQSTSELMWKCLFTDH